MRRLIVLTAALLVTLAAGSAFAQTDDGPEEKFYEFDEHEVEGGTVGPPGEHITGKKSSEFDPLLKLKKNFNDKIIESTEDVAFD